MDEIDLLLSEASAIKWQVYTALAVQGGALLVTYGWVLFTAVRRSRWAKPFLATARAYPLRVRLNFTLRREKSWIKDVAAADVAHIRELRKVKFWPVLLVLMTGTAVSMSARAYAQGRVERVQEIVMRVHQLEREAHKLCCARKTSGKSVRDSPALDGPAP